MSKIKLRQYQEDAVKFALKVPKCALCMRVGSGKTLCSMFSMRLLLKKKIVDKIVVSCTLSSLNAFIEDFDEKAGIKVQVIEDVDKFLDFLVYSEDKVCLVKHSFFEKVGGDELALIKLRKIADKYKVGLVIDEAHKIQNPEGIAQEAMHRMDFLFQRIILLTATPYSSCLSQFYGLMCLIHPELWKNKRAFYDRYIEEIIIRDPKTKRPVRKEKVQYKNLAEFRKIIEPYVYFYYPPVPLVHIEHTTRLEDYEKYNELCRGILTEEDKEKMEEARRKKIEKQNNTNKRRKNKSD